MNRDGTAATRRPSFGAGLPPRVLVVDDDELELALMADRLTVAGFEVTRAMNGEEALNLIRETWFPLVITDWQVPVMDGIQFTEELRRRGGSDDPDLGLQSLARYPVDGTLLVGRADKAA